MESTLEIRKRIHGFIDTADDRILRIFGGIIDAEEHEQDQPAVPEWFYEELDKRKERYINGESKSFTWEEVKAKAKASLK
jgi:hypothetical protein